MSFATKPDFEDFEMKFALDLRKQVLLSALPTEKVVNELLIVNIDIKADRPKIFKYKKINLGFSKKIELLHDLGIFSDSDFKAFDLLMQIRNPFMHDIECTTFEYALKSLDSGKRQFLLTFETGAFEEPEGRYLEAFQFLTAELMKIGVGKLNEIKATRQKREEHLTVFVESASIYADFVKELALFIKSEHDSTPENRDYVKAFHQFVKKISDFIGSESYTKIAERVQNVDDVFYNKLLEAK